MDLTDISYAQAVVDLGMANNRVLELSQRIAEASEELKELQARSRKLHSDSTRSTDSESHNQPASKNKSVRTLPKGPSIIRKLFRSGSPKRTILSHIDEIGGTAPSSSGRHIVSLGHVRQLSISGWAIPTGNGAPFEFVEVNLSGSASSSKKKVDLRDRPDVAKHFGNASLVKSGFSTVFSLSDLPPGIYSIEIEGGRTGMPAASTVANEIEIR